jgi:hypothetical protein
MVAVLHLPLHQQRLITLWSQVELAAAQTAAAAAVRVVLELQHH